MKDNEITEKIIGCAIKVHKEPGPGLLESVYVDGIKRVVNKFYTDNNTSV